MRYAIACACLAALIFTYLAMDDWKTRRRYRQNQRQRSLDRLK
jgi:hypothetical protein